MNTTTISILTGVIVVAGTWAKQQNGKALDLTATEIIGLTFMIFFLAIISNIDESIGMKFALLTLLGATFVYVPTILKKVGLTK